MEGCGVAAGVLLVLGLRAGLRVVLLLHVVHVVEGHACVASRGRLRHAV